MLLVSCLAATDAVRAQTLTYDDTVPERYVPLDEVLTFPQFDPDRRNLRPASISRRQARSPALWAMKT